MNVELDITWFPTNLTDYVKTQTPPLQVCWTFFVLSTFSELFLCFVIVCDLPFFLILETKSSSIREAQWCDTDTVLAFREGKLLREEIQK